MSHFYWYLLICFLFFLFMLGAFYYDSSEYVEYRRLVVGELILSVIAAYTPFLNIFIIMVYVCIGIGKMCEIIKYSSMLNTIIDKIFSFLSKPLIKSKIEKEELNSGKFL